MAEGSRHARHTRRRSWAIGHPAALAATVIVLLALGAAAGYVIGRHGATVAPGSPAAPLPAASSTPLPAHATMMGDVTRIVDGDEIVVRSGEVEVPVRVLGLTTPSLIAVDAGGSTTPACGSREALAFADAQLSGQTVTLVPDPTIPEVDGQGRRLAYVVLRSQLNFTDAALTRGIGRADTSRPLWYADVFTREQRTAIDRRQGIWGPPCRAQP